MSQALNQFAEKRMEKYGGDPEQVANLVLKICESKNPSLRNPIGKDAKLQILLRNILPASLENRLISSFLAKIIKKYKKI